MNMKISEEFGAYFACIPLKATPPIMCANALQTEWEEVLPARCSYVLGNPPFLVKSNQTAAQKANYITYVLTEKTPTPKNKL